ncbi:MAG: acetyl-CoA carboxylase biotin carboxyl carrier protein [Pseudomonadota bacterium]|nr:acetyl-CoA carboxylase biotin carboxyl carrier protein [Pseudomonadota bacterium]
MNYEPKQIEELAELLDKCKLTEIEVKSKDNLIRVSRQASNTSTVTTVSHEMSKPKENLVKDQEQTGTIIKSPMVGTVYLSPAPDAKPFVKVGTKVKKGDVLCLIEAMKMFNKIKAEKSGVIMKVLAQNEHPIEFGSKLFVIDES